MEKMNCIGTGNSCLSYDYQRKMLPLNNVELEYEPVKNFFEINKIEKFPIELSNRKTKNALGTCWPKQNRITLYRHSVAILLHEMAHILNYKKNGSSVLHKPHGKKFAEILAELIDMWEKTQK